MCTGRSDGGYVVRPKVGSWPAGWGRQRPLQSTPVRRTWAWLTGRYQEIAMAVLGTLLTSSLPDSCHTLCISERQLRSGRNFASTPGFYAL